MATTFDLTATQAALKTWFYNYVWTLDSLSQSGIIAVTAVLAFGIYKFISLRVTRAITGLRINPRLKQLAHNFRRQIFPALWIIFLLLVKIGMEVTDTALEMHLISAIINMLTAWIVIRLVVQFIGNSTVRNIFASCIWAIAALRILGLLTQTEAALDRFGMDIGHFHFSALTVIKGLFALCFLLYGAAFISSLLERRVRMHKTLTPTSKVLINKLTRGLLISFALLIAINAAGIDLSLLAVFSGAIGLGIGFGLQRVASNLLSGILLLLDHSIKPGDIIEMPNGAFGWVENMGARYTEIVTLDNKSYLIPNENFITQQVVNWSHTDTNVRLNVEFGVHYNSNPHHVKEWAEKAATTVNRVLKEPAPECQLIQFGDSALNFKLNFWIKDAKNGLNNVRSAVMLALWDSFKANGIEIPYPHRMVFMHNVDPDEKENAA